MPDRAALQTENCGMEYSSFDQFGYTDNGINGRTKGEEMDSKELEELREAVEVVRYSYKERMFIGNFGQAQIAVSAAIGREGYGLVKLEDAEKFEIEVI